MTLDVRRADAPHGYGPSVRRLWLEATQAGRTGDAAWQDVDAWVRHRPAAWKAEDARARRTGDRGPGARRDARARGGLEPDG